MSFEGSRFNIDTTSFIHPNVTQTIDKSSIIPYSFSTFINGALSLLNQINRSDRGTNLSALHGSLYD